MTSRRTRYAADLVAAGLASALVVLAVIVGYRDNHSGHPVNAEIAPLYGGWGPRLGPYTPLALAVALLVVTFGPRLAARLAWKPLLALGYFASLAWTVSLAVIDGWHHGIEVRLGLPDEYLWDAWKVHNLAAAVRGFAPRIVDFHHDSWGTQIAGHPPGALIAFVLLDRIGLGSSGVAGLVCIAVGATAAISVPVTLRALGSPDAARTAVPFMALFPGAIWVGVSGDGLFTGVVAAGVALLAVAVSRTGVRSVVASVAAGLVLGYVLFLSYGYVLLAPIVLAVALLGRRFRPVVVAAVAATSVVAAFLLAGFWWLDGYHELVIRYYQGIAKDRAYSYWVWANLASLALSAGIAVAPILRRAVVALPRPKPFMGTDAESRSAGGREWRRPEVLLPLAALLAVLVATISGMSKAEVERIWLPFEVWMPAGAALLPRPSQRGWLVMQALTALVVNHLVYSN